MKRNYPSSVRARLLKQTYSTGENFQWLLIRYVIERFLYRLSKSEYKDRFILKGGTLFTLWLGKTHRATKDLDLLGYGTFNIVKMISIFKEIAGYVCIKDGVFFDIKNIIGKPIRQDARYQGIRLILPGNLAGARFRLQVDIGMGDATVPKPSIIEMNSILDLPTPHVFAYRPETVVAEKLEALIALGLATSRMKDLYDLRFMRDIFDYDNTLIKAVKATFSRRNTSIPTNLPIGLSDAFAINKIKLIQWQAFLKKSGVEHNLTLFEVITNLREWLWPVLKNSKSNP